MWGVDFFQDLYDFHMGPIREQEQTLFNDLRQGPCKGKKDLCIKEGVPLHFKIIVRKERVDQRYFIPATFFRTINLE